MTAADVIQTDQSNGRANRTAAPTVLSIAWRQVRGGFSGFYVFIACIALGVAAITGVGALSDSLRSGLEAQGRTILGGDIRLTRVHTRTNAKERALLNAEGVVSETAGLRTMVRAPGKAPATLVQLRAVDTAYPLVGKVEVLQNKNALQSVSKDTAAIVGPLLLERLSVGVGDKIRIGKTDVEIAGVLASIPDRLSGGIAYGPPVIVSLATLDKTGLIKPGALVKWRYAIDLSASSADVVPVRERLARALPEGGFTVVDRRNPSPQITRTIERLRQFLTLIGLTALLVGGVGVANAVATYIDRRRKVIATMKSLGATSTQVFAIFLGQVLMMALIGIAIGLCFGVLVPLALDAIYGSALPFEADLRLSWRSVAVASGYGLAIALLFSLWPLGRAQTLKPAVLFRDEVVDGPGWPRPWIIALTCVLAISLVAVSILTSDARHIALYFFAAVIVVFAVFYVLGTLTTHAARRVPVPRRPELALALRNIGAPGGLTRAVVISLGTGLSLLVAIALANASLVAELTRGAPETSPDYYLLDVPREKLATLEARTKEIAASSELHSAPMLRGRIVKLNGTPAAAENVAPDARWVLRGDRGLTYAHDLPKGSQLIAGEWWGKDYSGPPLVSFDADMARRLGLKMGETITVNVLGRNMTARIHNLRKVNWESLAINFFMVFSPNTLEAAPHNLLATVRLPSSAPVSDEAALARAIGKEFPEVTAIRVRDAIAAINEILANVMVAIRAAGSVTLIAGALVLAGAMAAAQRRRLLEAVILKTLGATRRRIMTAHAAEYLWLALLTAVFAIGLGAAAAWAVLTQVMEVPFTFSPTAVAVALLLSVTLVLGFGAVATGHVLAQRPVPHLRSE